MQGVGGSDDDDVCDVVDIVGVDVVDVGEVSGVGWTFPIVIGSCDIRLSHSEARVERISFASLSVETESGSEVGESMRWFWWESESR